MKLAKFSFWIAGVSSIQGFLCIRLKHFIDLLSKTENLVCCTQFLISSRSRDSQNDRSFTHNHWKLDVSRYLNKATETV